MKVNMNTKFELGKLVATPGALDVMEKAEAFPIDFFMRHVMGDWGTLDAEDAAMNDAAIENGDRILSVYPLAGGAKIWIITEADRSSTTILLPSEY